MVVPHGGVLGPGALGRRWLVAHALVAVGRLRHLAAGGQLAPRQLPTAGAEARAVEPAASSAQVPVLHAGGGYLTRGHMCSRVRAAAAAAGAGAQRTRRRFSSLGAHRAKAHCRIIK